MHAHHLKGFRDWGKSLRFYSVALGLVLGLAACSVGPNYQQPSAPMPATNHYKNSNGVWQVANPQDSMIRGKWWEMFRDPQLNALEEQVNISNQNIKQYEANFRAAAAATKIARAAMYPTVSASPAFTESRASRTIGNNSSSNSQSLYDIPASASYLVDVWGSVRRNIEANTASAQASFADLENARLSYQATLAINYFEVRGLDEQKRILEATLRSYQEYLTLTQNRYQSGVASQQDVVQAQAQVDQAKVQLTDLGISRAQYVHAIAVLIGKPASDFSISESKFVYTVPVIPLSLPSELLQRRPDIASAERQVAAANANIGVNVAAYYPQITLTGEAGLQSIEISKLFDGPSLFWSIGPMLAQTIFDGGKIHGQVLQAEANYDATVAGYRQTVLTAFQQIEDSLAGLRILKDEIMAQNAAVQSTQKSLDIATNQYKAGIVDYLNVITAQNTVLSNQLNAAGLQTRQLVTGVQLIEALGGGWDISRLPAAGQIANAAQAPPDSPSALNKAAANKAAH